MPSYRYDRLSAQDNTFLLAESAHAHTHVAGIQIFAAGRLRTPSGGIDYDAIRRATEAVLHRIPRYRQRLRWTPLVRAPVWVDDPHFDLEDHMRHTSLPRPGTNAQLKQLAARVMAQQLDRAKPLWQTWVVEGLEDDRFAIVSKIHHCMIDGSAGVDLSQILLSLTPEQKIEPPVAYVPKPPPSPAELLRDELARRATLPLRAFQSWRRFRREAGDLRLEIEQRLKALGELAGWAASPAPDTPLNGPLGPHRRFDWLEMSLPDAKAVRRAAGCSLNDVVLTTVSGAIRAYLLAHGFSPDDIDFRISAPVSVRRAEERGQMGNRVSSWIIRLPLEESEARSRLAAIHETTEKLKESRQALGIDMVMQVAEWTPPVLLSLGAQAASAPLNSIVTNVPGPQFPLYLLGAELLEMYPVVPLLEGMGLGIALLSYNGRLFWGFNADYDLVPDLELVPGLVETSFQELAREFDVKLESGPQEG